MASTSIHPKAGKIAGKVIAFRPADGRPHLGIVEADGAELVTSDPDHFRALAAKLVEVADAMDTAADELARGLGVSA